MKRAQVIKAFETSMDYYDTRADHAAEKGDKVREREYLKLAAAYSQAAKMVAKIED